MITNTNCTRLGTLWHGPRREQQRFVLIELGQQKKYSSVPSIMIYQRRDSSSRNRIEVYSFLYLLIFVVTIFKRAVEVSRLAGDRYSRTWVLILYTEYIDQHFAKWISSNNETRRLVCEDKLPMVIRSIITENLRITMRSVCVTRVTVMSGW